MRRLFVLFIIFLIPLQFFDEAFDRFALPVAESSIQLAQPQPIATPKKCPGQASEVCSISSAPSVADIELSDVILSTYFPQPISHHTVWATLVHPHVFALRVFPIFEPPRA